MDPTQGNGSARPPKANRKSSTSALLTAFRNLTTRSLSSTQSPPLNAVSTAASLTATLSERDTSLWSSQMGVSAGQSSSLFDSSRQSVPGPTDTTLLAGASAELNSLFIRLQPGKPLSGRIPAALETANLLSKQKVKEVIPIWASGSDLIHEASYDAIDAGLKLLTSCIQSSQLSLLDRTLFWESLIGYEHSDHIDLRLRALKALSDNGRNIECLQVELATYLSKLLQEAFAAASQLRKKDHKHKGDPSSRQEQNLSAIFQFTTDIVRFNSITLTNEDLSTIIMQLVSICRETTSKVDLTNATNVMSAMATFTNISSATFQPCIDLLCQIYRQIDSIKDHTWSIFKRIFQSNLKNDVVTNLFETLQGSPDVESNANSLATVYTVQGAFYILQKLTLDNGMDGLPDVSLATFATAVNNALQRVKDPSFRLDVLKFYDCILDEPSLQKRLVDDVDWIYFSQSLENCYSSWAGTMSQHGSTIGSDGDLVSNQEKSNGDINSSKKSADKELNESVRIFNDIIDKLCLAFDDLNIIHQDEAVRLFFRLGDDLNNNAARVLLSHLETRPTLMPPSFGTRQQVWRHMAIYIAHNVSRPPSLRVATYEYLTRQFDAVRHLSHEDVEDFTNLILQNMEIEEDSTVLDILASFAARVLNSELRDVLFESVISKVRYAVFNRRPNTTPSMSRRPSLAQIPLDKASEPSLCRIIVRHIIRLFLTIMNQSGVHADSLFHFILDVAATESLDADARICALKLLFRLRCTADYRVYVVSVSESESIAAIVWRTSDTAVLAATISDGRGESNPSTGQNLSMAAKTKSINIVKTVPPLWFYPGPKALPQEPSEVPSLVLYAQSPENKETVDPLTTLPISLWLENIIHILQQPKQDWEIYSYVLVHLGAQLKNKTLFDGAIRQIRLLRNIICDQIRSSSFQTPPSYTSLKKADVAICLFHILTMLVGHNEHFAKSEADDIVKMFILGIGNWDGTSKWCIHGLAVCCHEMPLSVSKSFGDILLKMSQVITQHKIAMHILEFLCSLARLPEIFKNCTENEYRLVFTVSFRYLEWVRHQKQKAEETNSLAVASIRGSKRYSDSIREVKPPAETEALGKDKLDADLPQYVYALAYHAITFWFMALKLQDRPHFMQIIAKNLTYEESPGKYVIEDQGMVTLDMMDRIAYSDRDETACDVNFAKPTDGEIRKQTWIVGMSLLTIETAGRTGVSQLTRRRPSGTRYTIYQPSLTSPPRHQVPIATGLGEDVFYTSSYIGVLPQDIIQELYSSMSLASFPLSTGSIPEAPILLPDNDVIDRAISSFDRNSIVDGHRIGVIYIGVGQAKENEILANIQGSPAYTEFVSHLGTLVRLKDANMNTQGLDRSADEDGRYAYCWRDRSTEVVFHVTTMMPTDLENDPMCMRKKAHIGNDFVNIIWNDSGVDFNFNTFPSDFNYVYIVITPEVRTDFVFQRRHIEHEPTSDIIDQTAQTSTIGAPSLTSTLFYKLQVLSAPGFPSISSAAESKLVSAKALPPFVRLLALNASFFSLVWATRDGGGEHISPWRNRLRELRKLRDKYGVNGDWLNGVVVADGAIGSISSINGVAGAGGSGSGGVGGVGSGSGNANSPTVVGAAVAAVASARNSSGLLQPPALGRASQRGSMSFGGVMEGAF